jgi:Fur family zinc uptake transcriptional regulator
MMRSLSANDQAVAAALREGGRPLGAYDLVDLLKGQGITAPTTVYRALDRLMKLGIVHRLESLNAYVLCARDHPHGPTVFAICEVCGSVEEFADHETAKRLLAWASTAVFTVEATTIELRGRCRNCACAIPNP